MRNGSSRYRWVLLPLPTEDIVSRTAPTLLHFGLRSRSFGGRFWSLSAAGVLFKVCKVPSSLTFKQRDVTLWWLSCIAQLWAVSFSWPLQLERGSGHCAWQTSPQGLFCCRPFLVFTSLVCEHHTPCGNRLRGFKQPHGWPWGQICTWVHVYVFAALHVVLFSFFLSMSSQGSWGLWKKVKQMEDRRREGHKGGY